MKRSIMIIAILAAVLLTGCSAPYDSAMSKVSRNENGYGSAPEIADYDYKAMDNYAGDFDSNQISQKVTGSADAIIPAEGDAAKKIIRNASFDIIVEDVAVAYTSLADTVTANGGYVFNHNSYKYGGYTTVNVTFKIKPENIEALISSAETMGEVINTSITSEDITDSYYDSKLRLDTLRKSLDKYYEFLEATETVEDMLHVQREIDRLVMEIEAFEGKLKMYDILVAEATVHVTINQKEDPLKPAREINWNTLTFSDMGYLIKSGFLGTINVIATAAQWLLIVLVTLLPVIVIVGVVVVVLVVVIKRNRKKKNS